MHLKNQANLSPARLSYCINWLCITRLSYCTNWLCITRLSLQHAHRRSPLESYLQKKLGLGLAIVASFPGLPTFRFGSLSSFPGLHQRPVTCTCSTMQNDFFAKNWSRVRPGNEANDIDRVRSHVTFVASFPDLPRFLFFG